MKGRLFLIHWNQGEAEEHAQKLRATGWDVDIEYEDGARGGKTIDENPPDAVVIYLTRLPSHGRQTATHLREMRATRDLPIIFVGGKDQALEKTMQKVPDGIYISEEELNQALRELSAG